MTEIMTDNDFIPEFIPEIYTCLNCGAHVPKKHVIPIAMYLLKLKDSNGDYLFRYCCFCENCCFNLLHTLAYNRPWLFNDYTRDAILHYKYDIKFLQLYDKFKKQVDDERKKAAEAHEKEKELELEKFRNFHCQSIKTHKNTSLWTRVKSILIKIF